MPVPEVVPCRRRGVGVVGVLNVAFALELIECGPRLCIICKRVRSRFLTRNEGVVEAAIVDAEGCNVGLVAINRNEPSAEVTAAKSVRTLLERAELRGMSTGMPVRSRAPCW